MSRLVAEPVIGSYSGSAAGSGSVRPDGQTKILQIFSEQLRTDLCENLFKNPDPG